MARIRLNEAGIRRIEDQATQRILDILRSLLIDQRGFVRTEDMPKREQYKQDLEKQCKEQGTNLLRVHDKSTNEFLGIYRREGK